MCHTSAKTLDIEWLPMILFGGKENHMQYFYPYEVVRTKDKSVYHKLSIIAWYEGQYSCCACSKPWPDICCCPSTESEAAEHSKAIMDGWANNHPVMQLEKRWHDAWVAQGGSQSVSAECDWKRKHGRWDTPPKEPPLTTPPESG